MQKDGWFVTKIARTKHFDALISSMAQLFKKVYVTKPEASRSDSSESYAVCRGYLAPKRVEKSLISVDTVLKEHTLVSVLKSINDIFKMNQKKLVQNLAHIPTKSAVSQFLKSDNYLDILGGSYQVIISILIFVLYNFFLFLFKILNNDPDELVSQIYFRFVC